MPWKEVINLPQPISITHVKMLTAGRYWYNFQCY